MHSTSKTNSLAILLSFMEWKSLYNCHVALGVSVISTRNCSSFVYRSHEFFVVIKYQSERI